MLSHDVWVKIALHRKEVFSNLPKYLKIILDTVKELDKNAKVYLFGSVAEGKHLLSSDIDILVLTSLKPGLVIAKLWEKGIGDPFEIHVVDENMFEIYKRRAKLIPLEELVKDIKE